MADQKGDLDASEPATAFKLDKAHERGSIYRSADLTFAMVLCVCVACVYGLGMRVVDGVGLMIRHGLSFAARDEMTQAVGQTPERLERHKNLGCDLPMNAFERLQMVGLKIDTKWSAYK